MPCKKAFSCGHTCCLGSDYVLQPIIVPVYINSRFWLEIINLMPLTGKACNHFPIKNMH
jgi:hypothetical protein